jgi:TPR repeat protein
MRPVLVASCLIIGLLTSLVAAEAGAVRAEDTYRTGEILWRSGSQADRLKAIACFQAAAAAGYADAQYTLGQCYAEGRDVGKNEVLASEWLLKAALQDHPWAQIQMAKRYDSGDGVARSAADAQQWYQREYATWLRRARTGDGEAMVMVGTRHFDGNRAVPKDVATALTWYRAAADAGWAPSMRRLGELYAYGYGSDVPKDQAEATRWQTREFATRLAAAERGIAAEQRELGDMYTHGIGVRPHPATAFSWYLKAAEGGDLEAQSRVAACYESGTGVIEDRAEAIRWYGTALDAGASPTWRIAHCFLDAPITDERIARHLATSFERQVLVSEPLARALYAYHVRSSHAELAATWRQRADALVVPPTAEAIERFHTTKELAHGGSAKYMFLLGLSYAGGVGVAADDQAAWEWFSKAAKLGSCDALIQLAAWCDMGKVPAATPGLAVTCLTTAAERGSSAGAYQLGLKHYHGRGVPKDIAVAYMWFNIGAARNDERAAGARDLVEARLTKDQIAEAQRLTRDWMAKHP